MHTQPARVLKPAKRPNRFSWAGCLALVTVIAATLLPAAGAAAETPHINCPQLKAVVGIPVSMNVILPDPTPNLGVSIENSLPDGLRLFSEPTRAYVSGTPTKVGNWVFFLTATVGVHGAPVTVSNECIMVVKPMPTVTRIGGTDRYDQSARVSHATYDHAKTVYLASGEKFSDALSASSVAAHHDSPLLLTGSTSVPATVMAEITRLAPTDIVIVGGTASVTDAVSEQLRALITKPTVTRIAGADRFEVSRNLIGHPAFGMPKSDVIYIATGFTFPDALGASPAAANTFAPVLLVNGAASNLSAAETATVRALGAKSAIVVGGPASVSPALVADLTALVPTQRVDGADRFQVNAALNESSFYRADRVYIASAAVFPDALSGGAAAGHFSSPLYISSGACLPYEAYNAIGRLAPDEVIILGGTATLSPPVESLVPCSAH